MLVALLALMLAGTAVPAAAQSDVQPATEAIAEDAGGIRKIRVGVREAPPFTSNPSGNHWTGLSVDLWYAIVGDRAIETEFVEVELVDTINVLTRPAPAGVESVDIIISPLTITADREEVVDFSHQYFPSGLAFAVPKEISINVAQAVDQVVELLLSPVILTALTILLLIIVLFSVVAYWASRDFRNQELIKTSPTGRAAIFTIMGTLKVTGVDKEIFGFRSWRMLAFSIFLLVFGSVVSSVGTGVITASLTLSAIGGDQLKLADLKGKRVAVITGSTHEAFLDANGPDVVKVPIDSDDGHQHGLDMVVSGDADIFLGDDAQLRYLIQQGDYKDKIMIQPRLLTFEPYGWAVPTGAPRREELNIELIRFLRSPDWPDLQSRYYRE